MRVAREHTTSGLRQILVAGSSWSIATPCNTAAAPVGLSFVTSTRKSTTSCTLRSTTAPLYLFSHATVCAQTFRSDATFRAKVNAILPNSHGIGNPASAVASNDYRVVLAIIGGPGSCEKLPFFSRLTLRNCHRTIDAYGYRVAVSHIPYAQTYAKKSRYRAASPRG